MQLRITHLSFSLSGGAGQVANALSLQQNLLGHQSQFHYVTKSNLRQDLRHNLTAGLLAGVDNFIIKNPKHRSLISVTRDLVRGMEIDSVPAGDILHLHWINGLGQRGLEDLSRRFKCVFFTMHDMNPITSVCHQSLGCSSYLSSCQGACPAVRTPFQKMVPELLQKKLEFLTSIKNLTMIAPSRWLESGASKVLADLNIPLTYIANPINSSVHQSAENSLETRSREVRAITFGFISTDLRDPNKGFAELLDAFNLVSSTNTSIRLIAAGEGSSHFSGPSVRFLGPLVKESLSDFYSSIDVLVIPSLAENSPLVAAEAACFGKTILMRDIPAAMDLVGLPDIYKVELFRNNEDLVSSLARLSDSDLGSVSVEHKINALSFYDPRKSAISHLKLYTDSLRKFN